MEKTKTATKSQKNSIEDKLLNIQSELEASKGQFNKFGSYYYRSCEDILKALKPLLRKNKAIIKITDEIVFVEGRFYIKATAQLKCVETREIIETSAFAREAEIKKGMDESQITGAASSYARKYALNGLFAIDDTKDADTQDNTKNGIDESDKRAIQNIKTLEELVEYYKKNKGKGKEFEKLLSAKKKELQDLKELEESEKQSEVIIEEENENPQS